MQKETSNIISEFAKQMQRIENMHLPDISGNLNDIKKMVADCNEEGLKALADKLQSENNNTK